jgi:hypothetical protein
MKFNLRKARKLENKIGAFIGEKQRELDSCVNVRVNEDLNNIDNIVNEARAGFFNEFNNINNLMEARQNIRNLIGEANQKESINEFISQKVLAEAKLSKINSILGFETFDKKQTEDSLEYSKKALENGERYARTTVKVSFLTNIDEDKFKTDKRLLVKQIEELDDKLAKLNYTIEVQLDANTVKLLKDNFLL